MNVEKLASLFDHYVVHFDGEDHNLGSVIRAQENEIKRLQSLVYYGMECTTLPLSGHGLFMKAVREGVPSGEIRISAHGRGRGKSLVARFTVSRHEMKPTDIYHEAHPLHYLVLDEEEALITADRGPHPWPAGCLKPNSCARNKVCSYRPGCTHQDRDIRSEIEQARAQRATE